MGEQIQTVISPEMIFLEQTLAKKEGIIQFITNKAVQLGRVKDAEQFYQAVINREEEVSTAIGYSIAMPHGKSDTVLAPFISFVRLAEPIFWNEGDDETVELIFLIGVPKESEGKLHLRFISQLSKRLLDEDFRGRLHSELDPIKVYEQLNTIEV